jgi:hypothetical protein
MSTPLTVEPTSRWRQLGTYAIFPLGGALVWPFNEQTSPVMLFFLIAILAVVGVLHARLEWKGRRRAGAALVLGATLLALGAWVVNGQVAQVFAGAVAGLLAAVVLALLGPLYRGLARGGPRRGWLRRPALGLVGAGLAVVALLVWANSTTMLHLTRGPGLGTRVAQLADLKAHGGACAGCVFALVGVAGLGFARGLRMARVGKTVT